MSATIAVTQSCKCSQKSDTLLTLWHYRSDDTAEHSCLRDRERLDVLVRNHRPLLRMLAANYTSHREEAEEIEANTILAICRRFASYDPARGAFGTWIGTILRHEVCDMRRRAARQPICVPNGDATERILAKIPAVTEPPCPESVYDADLLPPLVARAFQLVAVDGLTGKQAADVLGTTEGSVRTYVWRARKVLRQRRNHI